MSHHHDHHNHDHHNHVHTVTKSALSFEEQLATLVSHWIKHNESHAGTYGEWAEKAKKHNLDKAAEQLEEISALTLKINSKLEEMGLSADS